MYKRLTAQAELTVITIHFWFLFITNIVADNGNFTPITRVRMAYSLVARQACGVEF